MGISWDIKDIMGIIGFNGDLPNRKMCNIQIYGYIYIYKNILYYIYIYIYIYITDIYIYI